MTDFEIAAKLLKALETLLARCNKLDQSATHEGLENCDAIREARSAISEARKQL